MQAILKIKMIAVIMIILLIGGLGFSQEDSRYDADKNLPFNEKAGDVNPQTGSITIGVTDVALPGRAGFDFSFGRIWSLSQANVFNMYYKDGNNRLNSNTAARYNRMGIGWSTTLPYIMENFDTEHMVLNLFFGGNAYEIDQTGINVKNLSKSNLLGYDLVDLRIYKDSAVNYGMFDGDLTGLQTGYGINDTVSGQSAYLLMLKDNSKYWFREDGLLMMQEDRTGLNKIWYFYEEMPGVSGENRLRVVVDTIGREIVFDYDLEGNLNKIEWEVLIGKMNPDGTRERVTETRSIEYEYTDCLSMQYIMALSDDVLDYKDQFMLTKVKDQMGFYTRYDYEEGLAGFTFNKNISHSQNVYLLLTQITDMYTEEGGYLNKRCFEYEVPADGMHTKWFYTGYMEYYKISRQYNINRNGRIMNDINYVYYDEGEGGNYSQYTAVITMGNTKTTYFYTLDNSAQDHVLDKLLIETNDGFRELRDYVYDNDRKKTLDEVFRMGSFAYREHYIFDDKGNLKRFEDRGGLVVTRTYDDIYSIPLSEEKKVTVNGVLKTYMTENEINGIGQVIKQTIYVNGSAIDAANIVYDIYGNAVSSEDAKGNIIYTVYDEDHHAFPVKIYQDVDIADWNGGSVHDNWLTDPAGTKLVRIRSWKVFNSDGSIWIEVDNEGYAVEHYYDKLGTEIETVNPDLDDVTGFATPITIVDGIPQGSDFDDFAKSAVFGSFLTSRMNNPGARMDVDYQNDFIKTYADIDLANGDVKTTGRQGDGLGNVEAEIEYDGSGSEYSVKEMEYDDYGRMLALTDPDADRSGGVPITVNGTTVTRYNKTWIVKYDDLGRQIKVLYPKTADNRTDIKLISYDDLNNTVTTTDPAGRKIKEDYDWKGNLVKLTRYGDTNTPADKVEEYFFTYDELNRKIKMKDAKGIETSYRYDERNLLLEQNYGASGSDIMEYNELGQLIKKTDRKNQVISFTYDKMGRNTKAIHYKSVADYNSQNVDHTVELAYDNRGNAVRVANQNLIEHYIYDFANRPVKLERRLKDGALRQLISDRVWGGDESTQVFSYQYTYNDAGMVTSMVYPDGSIHEFEYDNALARLTGIDENSNPFVTGLTYNKSGVVTRMDYANNTNQTWEFDNRKRISHISISTSETVIDLTYQLNGVGDVLKINDNEYNYDGFDRIVYAKTLIPENANQQDIQNLILEHFGAYMNDTSVTAKPYDPAADLNSDGRINGFDHIAASFDSMTEEYDVESFEYDKNGNRTKLVQNGDVYTYTYGLRNRLEKIELQKEGESVKTVFAEYLYDANGNTIKRTIHTDEGDKIIDFVYDTMNRLTKTTENNGDVTEYLYDNAGNRFIKKSPESTTVYLRHGQIAVAMDIELPVDTSENNGIINRYVLSGDLLAGRITTTYKADNTTVTEKYYYHLDHLNSTKCVTKQDGTLYVMYEYRAFGEQLKKLGEGDAKYTYGGKELDDETNLYYFNARYYDATTGRFINVDPIQDGWNWYVYCNNNPLCFVDPTGLSEKDTKYMTTEFKGIVDFFNVILLIKTTALVHEKNYSQMAEEEAKAVLEDTLVGAFMDFGSDGSVKGIEEIMKKLGKSADLTFIGALAETIINTSCMDFKDYSNKITFAKMDDFFTNVGIDYLLSVKNGTNDQQLEIEVDYIENIKFTKSGIETTHLYTFTAKNITGKNQDRSFVGYFTINKKTSSDQHIVDYINSFISNLQQTYYQSSDSENKTEKD